MVNRWCFGRFFEPYLKNPAEIVVPTTLQFELYKWSKREKGEVKAMEVIALTEHGRVLSLNTGLALFAVDMALQYGLSFADAISYASARQSNVPLITADDHFQGLPDVIYFPKKAILCDSK
jgi:predicted nucleic acid-binding protein